MAVRRWDQSDDIPTAPTIAATDEVLLRRPGNAPAMQPMKGLISALPAGPKGDKGDVGALGWSPVFSVENDGTRRVLRITDWTGGGGTKPNLPANPYLGSAGLVATAPEAISIRGATGLTGNTGAMGDDGWAPVFSVESDGARRVLKITDWAAGEGAKPALPTNPYIGSSGLVANAASAVDIRGATGNTGDAGTDGDNAWSPIIAVENDSARRVLKITDWAGGEGTKPAVPSNPYIGSSGLVANAASAVDIRGATGLTGNTGGKGDTGDDAWSPIIAVESDGARRVLKITGWTGGEGSTPAVPGNPYIGSSGLVANAASAIDIRGATGSTGNAGTDGDNAWSPVFSVENSGQSRVLKIVDWAGGEGTKPAVPSDPYIGSSGLVADAASAVNIRGSKGNKGDTGDQGAYDVVIFKNATNAASAGTPSGGSIVVTTRVVTLPTGWALDPTSPPDGQETFASRVTVNPATQTGTITPTWSAPYLAGGTGPTGADGNDGWSPVIAAEVDNARRVLKIVDWAGGEGTKPAVPSDPYIGASGLVATAAAAIDIRGAAGAAGADGSTGSDGNDAWSPIIAVESDGARRVLKITGWTGGEGSTPAVPGNPYIGASGLVANAASAVDIRGAAGTAGSDGAAGNDGNAGADGNDGWAPVIAIEADNERRVLKIVDWSGGEGAKPALPTNPYIGSTGLVATATAAQDIRGPSGGFSLTTIGDADLTSLSNSLTWFDTGIDMPDTVASGEIWALRAVDSGNASSERDPEDIIFFAASDVSGAANSTSGAVASPSENAGFVFQRHLANADQTFILGKDSNGNILLWSRNSISRGVVLEIWRVGGTGSGGGLTLPTTVTQAEAEAGTETNVRSWTPKRVAQAIAALGADAITDAAIGEKAFKNPPGDLTDEEKTAVRDAIGSGADDDDSGGGFSLEEIAITDAIPGTDVNGSTWFDTGLDMPADVPDNEVWAIQLYKNNATANKIEHRLIFVRAAIVRDATAQIAAQQASQPHRNSGFGFHVFVDSDSVASDWILGRNSDNDILLWGSVGQASSTLLTLAIYRVVGSGAAGGGAAITHPAPAAPANAEDDKLYAASGNVGPLQYQVVEAAKTAKITSEPLESRGQHYIVHGWARVRAGQASRTGGNLDPIPEGWRALIEFNQSADADGWAVELVTDRAEPWLSLTSGLTLRITGTDGTLRTRVLNQSIASDHINFIATGQSRALLEEGETLVLAVRDHGAAADRDLHAGAAFYRDLSTDAEITAIVAARLRSVLSDITSTDADLNAIAALTRQIIAELKPLGAVAGVSNWQDIDEAELQEHYGVAVQPQSDTDFAGAVFYSSRLEESGGARIMAVSVPHGIDPASVRLRQRRAGSDIDTLPNAAQEWEAFTPSDALRHVDYYRLIGSTSGTWAAVALQTGDSIVLQVAELSHALSIPLSALAQGGATGGQALVYDADADEWGPGDVAAGGDGGGSEQSFRAPLNDVASMPTSYTRLALGTPDIDQGDFTVATNRVAVTHAGRYLVIGHITADSSSGNDGSQDRVRLYGRLARRASGTTTASEEVVTDYARRQYSGFYALSVEVSELFDLAAGEEIELQGYAQKQDTATTVALDGSGSSLALVRVGAVVSAGGLRDALIGTPPNQPVIPQDAGSLSAHHAAWGGGFDPTTGGPFGVAGLLLEPVSPVPNTDVRYVSTGGRVQIGRHLNSRGQLLWRDTYGVADPARCILQASLTAAAGSEHLMVFCIGTNNPAQLSGDTVNRGWQLFDRGIAIALDPIDGNGNGGGTLNMMGCQDAGGGAAYNVNDGFWGNAVARATAGMWEVPSGVSGVVADPSTTNHRQNARLKLDGSRRLDASNRKAISIETFDRELRVYWDRELIAIWHWAAAFAPFRSGRARGNNYMVRSTAGDRVVVNGSLTSPATYCHEFAVSPAQRRSPGYDRFV